MGICATHACILILTDFLILSSLALIYIYTIQAGDNLTKIANANDTTVQKLVKLNNISNPNRIIAGQTIKLVEDTPVQQPMQQPHTSEQIQEQLEATQKQLEQIQNQMNTQSSNTSPIEMFGYGMAGVATYELGKKALYGFCVRLLKKVSKLIGE